MAFRIMLIMLAGWLTVANAQAPTPQPVVPSVTDRPCTANAAEDRKSELCAQWNAADASRDSARWSLASAILAGLGTIGLLFSLYYTRRAVLLAGAAAKDTERAIAVAERNADAASAAVRVSENTANHQLRAYLGVREVVAAIARPEHIAARVVIHNFGETPAHNVAATIVGWAGAFPSSVLSEGHPDPESQICPASVHPKADFELFAVAEITGMEGAILDGDKGFYVYGDVSYDDFNGIRRVTNFCFRGTESTLIKKGQMRVSFEGNQAT